MANYEDDQTKTTTIVANATHTNVNTAQLKASSPAGTVYTFTSTYHFVYNGMYLDYRKGLSYVLDPTLKAKLLSVGAPMVAA